MFANCTICTCLQIRSVMGTMEPVSVHISVLSHTTVTFAGATMATSLQPTTGPAKVADACFTFN